MVGRHHTLHRLLALGALVAAFAIVSGCAKSESVSVPSTGPVLSGGVAAIDSVLSASEGKWVMVNVWATWCRPCVAETPDLVAFANQMREQPFTFLGVSTDMFTASDTTAARKVNEFQTKHSIPYPNLLFTGGMDELTDRLQLSGVLPTTIVFDPSGKLAEQYVGLVEKSDLDAIKARIGKA